ncbi:ketopantoate reductase family protein [Endozoicomonadaceae bacterium StTr2]
MILSGNSNLPDKEETAWHIAGAGAMGCLWAARLREKGHSCTLLVQSERLNQYSESNLVSYTSPDQVPSHNTIEVKVIDSPEQVINNLIIATKAGGVESVLDTLKPWITNNTRILLLQNGMGTQHQVARTFPENPIWAASITDGAWLKSPLNVQHAGYGQTFIGPMTAAAEAISDDFYRALQAPALSLEPVDNIEHKLWIKLAINSCVNGLTVLYRCRNGKLLDGGEREHHLQALCRETAQVLQAEGHLPEQPLLSLVTQVATATGKNYSSSYQDAANNRPTELAWINGVLIKEATKHGLDVSAHKALMETLNEAY